MGGGWGADSQSLPTSLLETCSDETRVQQRLGQQTGTAGPILSLQQGANLVLDLGCGDRGRLGGAGHRGSPQDPAYALLLGDPRKWGPLLTSMASTPMARAPAR